MPEPVDIIKEDFNKTEILIYLEVLAFGKNIWHTIFKDPVNRTHEFIIAVHNNVREKRHVTSFVIAHKENSVFGYVDCIEITKTAETLDLQFKYDERFDDLTKEFPILWTMYSYKMDWKWIEQKLKLEAIKQI